MIFELEFTLKPEIIKSISADLYSPPKFAANIIAVEMKKNINEFVDKSEIIGENSNEFNYIALKTESMTTDDGVEIHGKIFRRVDCGVSNENCLSSLLIPSNNIVENQAVVIHF